jgi:hypothetical protein
MELALKVVKIDSCKNNHLTTLIQINETQYSYHSSPTIHKLVDEEGTQRCILNRASYRFLNFWKGKEAKIFLSIVESFLPSSILILQIHY